MDVTRVADPPGLSEACARRDLLALTNGYVTDEVWDGLDESTKRNQTHQQTHIWMLGWYFSEGRCAGVEKACHCSLT